ncbi:MAG: MBL fold metallo-hydrolase [Deltaproteobacteria bacterium]|nr:MBL fold metallo-hydrolase [Candidatus Zymogenaceae bacterium]
MWIKQPGPVTDRIVLLGREESCIYLLKGLNDAEHAIIGGGMIHIVPEVLSQIRELGIDADTITRLLVLHTHFDHCGAVPALARRLKNLKVYTSPRGRELLSTPDVTAQIKALNEGMIAINKMEQEAREFGLVFDGIRVDGTVSGGDRVDWGGNELEIIDAPGHSSCSIAAYLPAEKALFASDAGGIPYGDTVFAAGNSNFTQFEETLQKFATYDVTVHLSEHYGAFTGADGKGFIGRAIAAAKDTRKLLEESYRKTRDIGKSTVQITDSMMNEAEGYFLPRPVVEMVVGQMLRHIAKTIDGK